MKRGIKTTEFWATLFGTILVSFASELGLNLDPGATTNVTALIATYVAGRVWHKHKNK